MGVGGGFILVPGLIYFFRIPPAVVVGPVIFALGFPLVFRTPRGDHDAVCRGLRIGHVVGTAATSGSPVCHRWGPVSCVRPQTPADEWPISVALEGGYHSLAVLFNRLSNFSRIMNVEQFTISALGQQTEQVLLAAGALVPGSKVATTWRLPFEDEVELKNQPDKQTLTIDNGGDVTRFRIFVTEVYKSIDGTNMALTMHASLEAARSADEAWNSWGQATALGGGGAMLVGDQKEVSNDSNAMARKTWSACPGPSTAVRVRRHPPLAVLENHLRMSAADVLVLDAYLAIL